MRLKKNDDTPRIVAMAMDFMPYLKELKGKRVLCDEHTHEAASMWRFMHSNRDKAMAKDFVVFHDGNRVSLVQTHRFVDESVDEPYRGDFIEVGSVCVTARLASECDVFIDELTAMGVDVHVAALFDDGSYVWRHARCDVRTV